MDFRTERGYFTEEFKRRVVSKVETGRCTIKELNATHRIQGHSTILKWCRLYGGKKYPMMRRTITELRGIRGDDEKVLLRNQIKVLEQELKEARWKQATLETLIDIAERHHSIVIKKNTGQERLTK